MQWHRLRRDLSGFPGGPVVKKLPVNAGEPVWTLGQKDLLEEEMATHFSILAWEIPWTEEPGGLQSMGLQRFGHDLATEQQQQRRDLYPDIQPTVGQKEIGHLQDRSHQHQHGEDVWDSPLPSCLFPEIASPGRKIFHREAHISSQVCWMSSYGGGSCKQEGRNWLLGMQCDMERVLWGALAHFPPKPGSLLWDAQWPDTGPKHRTHKRENPGGLLPSTSPRARTQHQTQRLAPQEYLVQGHMRGCPACPKGIPPGAKGRGACPSGLFPRDGVAMVSTAPKPHTAPSEEASKGPWWWLELPEAEGYLQHFPRPSRRSQKRETSPPHLCSLSDSKTLMRCSFREQG